LKLTFHTAYNDFNKIISQSPEKRPGEYYFFKWQSCLHVVTYFYASMTPFGIWLAAFLERAHPPMSCWNCCQQWWNL